MQDNDSDSLGAVLLQFQEGEWRAVLYASRNLTEVDRRYAQTEKKPSPYYGHVNGSTCMCMAVISNKKQTTNLSSAFLEVDPNHRQESRDGFSVYSATSTE